MCNALLVEKTRFTQIAINEEDCSDIRNTARGNKALPGRARDEGESGVRLPRLRDGAASRDAAAGA